MNIYVGSLAQDVTVEDLRKLFEEFGTVTSAKIIGDRFSGGSKGFGFVEMDSKEQGQEAIEALNGKELKGHQINVNEARPRNNRR